MYELNSKDCLLCIHHLDFNPVADSVQVHNPGVCVLPELHHDGQHPGQVEVAGDGVQGAQITWQKEFAMSEALVKSILTSDHHHPFAEILPLNPNSPNSDRFHALKKSCL